jgi:hypothetical protein
LISNAEAGNIFKDIPRQIMALTRKNFILAYRNRTATFLRIFSSFFFVLLIFLVNIGLKARFSADPYFKDFPSPPRTVIPGIPDCISKTGVTSCITFAYAPASDSSGAGIHPDADYSTRDDFATATDCPPASCAEMFRVHRIVRRIMANNAVGGSPPPVAAKVIPAARVLGFANATALDLFLFSNPNIVQVPTPGRNRSALSPYALERPPRRASSRLSRTPGPSR